jgi:hypothetical protein
LALHGQEIRFYGAQVLAAVGQKIPQQGLID